MGLAERDLACRELVSHGSAEAFDECGPILIAGFAPDAERSRTARARSQSQSDLSSASRPLGTSSTSVRPLRRVCRAGAAVRRTIGRFPRIWQSGLGRSWHGQRRGWRAPRALLRGGIRRDGDLPNAVLGELADVELEPEGIAEEARVRVHGDDIERIVAVTRAFESCARTQRQNLIEDIAHVAFDGIELGFSDRGGTRNIIR